MNRYRAEIYDRFRGQVTEELIVLINRERSGESVDRDILRGCIEVRGPRRRPAAHGRASLRTPACQVFDHMGQDCYMADLHAPVVAATRAYYASKASAWLVQESGPQYLMQVRRPHPTDSACALTHLTLARRGPAPQVERELQLEEERMSTYMLPHSVDQLRNVVLTELLEVSAGGLCRAGPLPVTLGQLLITPLASEILAQSIRPTGRARAPRRPCQRHVNSIVSREGSGVRAMLEKEREADLSRLFKLFLNVPAGLEPIAAVVRTFMEDTGASLRRCVDGGWPRAGGPCGRRGVSSARA